MSFQIASSVCFIVAMYFPKFQNIVIIVLFLGFLSLGILFPPDSVFLFVFVLLLILQVFLRCWQSLAQA